MNQPPPLEIDFVSDVVCPWCAIGLSSLELALAKLQPELGAVTLRFQPFELNPQMPPEGEDVTEHLQRKYGRTPQEAAQVRQTIQQRAEAVGFPMRIDLRSRIWNTFDAHRLLHAALEEGPEVQRAVKMALLIAYFRDGRNPSARDVLLQAAQSARMDRAEAESVVDDPGRHAKGVSEAAAQWRQAGIRSVPAIVINRQHLISGGQPPEVFERALRQIIGAPG